MKLSTFINTFCMCENRKKIKKTRYGKCYEEWLEKQAGGEMFIYVSCTNRCVCVCVCVCVCQGEVVGSKEDSNPRHR